MKWFLCAYPAWPHMAHNEYLPGDYSSFIRARDMKHAKKLAAQRNIGENVMSLWGGNGSPYIPVSEQLRRRSLTLKHRTNIIHAAVFMSYLLQRSMQAPPEAVLGDEGLLHQLMHNLSFGVPRKADLIATFQHFERMIPGYQ